VLLATASVTPSQNFSSDNEDNMIYTILYETKSSNLTTGQIVEAPTEQQAREFILETRPDAVIVWTEQSSNRDSVFKNYFDRAVLGVQNKLHGSTIGEKQNQQAIRDNVKLLAHCVEQLTKADLSSPEAQRHINNISSRTQRLLNLTYQS
jgi:hypothetical protein